MFEPFWGIFNNPNKTSKIFRLSSSQRMFLGKLEGSAFLDGEFFDDADMLVRSGLNPKLRIFYFTATIEVTDLVV